MSVRSGAAQASHGLHQRELGSASSLKLMAAKSDNSIHGLVRS